MTEALRAHLRLLESGLPRRTHESKPPPVKPRMNWTFKPELKIEKQKEIFRLHGQGMQGKDIATTLNISASTVSRYMTWKRP